jgi:hypothetical protein
VLPILFNLCYLAAGFGQPNFTQETCWDFRVLPTQKKTYSKPSLKTVLIKPTNIMEKKKTEEYFSQEIHNVHVWFALHFIPGYNIWLSPGSKWHFKQLKLKQMNI